MLPVLFSIGPISISSFGFFLALGFLYGALLVWRLARAWDLEEEEILDLVLLVFFGGLIGARVYFVLLHPSFFDDLFKAFLITKYPGFSFWGALLGGWLSLFYFTRRFKLNFWQIADIAVVGFLGGLILGDIGCLLGSCSVGVRSESFLAVNMVGVIGKRFPTPALEALLLIMILRSLWPKATHFHIAGQILSWGLIYLGLVKFILEFFRQEQGAGYIFSLVLSTLGVAVFYKISKRSPLADLRQFISNTIRFITENQFRNVVLSNTSKGWYNYFSSVALSQQVSWTKLGKFLNKFLKKIHVKPTPKDFRPY